MNSKKPWQPNENHGKPCDECGSTKDVQEVMVTVNNWRQLKKPRFEYQCVECAKRQFDHNTIKSREEKK